MPEWTPLMGVGIEEIDRGHRELVEKLNELGLEMKKGRGRNVLQDLFAFLQSHADAHFAAEERLMRRSQYPGYEEHQATHQAFRGELDARVRAFLHDPDDAANVVEIHAWIMRWLSKHEIAADAPLGDYLRDKGFNS